MPDAISESLQLSQTHYENFPVASILTPARLRRPVALIYAFARQADDFADEGDIPPQERLENLERFRRQLDNIAQHKPCDLPLFDALAEIIQQYRLPLQPFYDLLDAFCQDVTKTRYNSHAELLDYCRRSANPVGLLMLHLYGQATPQNIQYSNAICSALQLINFWQDISLDYPKGRIYLPQEDMARFGVSEENIASAKLGEAWRKLLDFQITRAEQLLAEGQPLGRILTGRIGLEMRLIIAGGRTILRKLRRVQGDVFNKRPQLKPWDWVAMLAQATFKI